MGRENAGEWGGLMGKTIDELLELPCWVVDILPRQVPVLSSGQYFAVEAYYLAEQQFSAIKQRHIDLVLKLNCYYDLSLNDEDVCNPVPERIAAEMRTSYVCIRMGEALIVSEPDDTCLALYNADAAMRELVGTLCAGEGLYLWKP